MPKILFYSTEKSDLSIITSSLKNEGYVLSCVKDFNVFFETIKSFLPDIVIISLENNIEDVSKICRKIRLTEQLDDVQILLIANSNTKVAELSQAADGYIQRPINKAILISMINSHLRLKNHLDVFSSNNNELANRYYQLNVLYDTNSKLAGSLNPKKLINIMNDGLEQSISYSLCSTLIINNDKDIVLTIDSLYPITKRLEQALKLRALLSYKSLFNDKELPFDFDTNDIKTELTYKQDDNTFDFEVLHYESLFAPLATQDKFFGIVEILRESELSKEDTTCFQTVISQVVLPLESAILYREIQEKNVKLEKLEKVKSEFISIVSHELRTPLTAIKNALDIILLGKTGEINTNMEKFLSMGKSNVDRLAVIINDLLDLSKIEAGKMEYRFQKINLREPVSFAISTFEAEAIKKEIELKSVIKVSEAFAYADSQKIEQVLKNLISNALKFTNSKGKITISLDNYKKDEKYWLIEIKDTGIGIKEENLSKVFDRFQQIESSLSRKVGGTGLGLPIAKEFVLAHKGDIWVNSKENKGTTFYFILPKFDEYMNFIIELGLFYEKSQAANANFAIMKIVSLDCEKIINYLRSENKTRKIFIKDNNIYVLLQNQNKNIYEIYLEKLQHFIDEQKNDNILLNVAYCNFDNPISLKTLVNNLETEQR